MRERLRRLLPAAGLLACALIPASLFLTRYLDGAGVAPAGSDTPQHVWRSRVVAELGLEALPAFEGSAQALNTNADRPGLPLLFAVTSAPAGDDATDLAYVLPAVAAAAIALAAAALAGSIPGIPVWGAIVVGVAAGTSAQVAFAANGYLDQLLVEPLLMAAAAAALRAAGGGRGRALGAILLLGAWLVHWQFALLFTGLLVLLAIACVPASLRARRQGVPLGRTPAARVAATMAGGAGLGVAALLLGTPGVPRPPTGLAKASVDRQLADQAGRYRLPGSVPFGIVGGVSLAGPRRDPGRFRAAWLLIPWALVPVAGGIVHFAGRSVPVQRGLSFALAIPMLAALGAIAIVSWARGRMASAAGVAGAVLLAAALAASAWVGWDVWRTRRPWSDDARLAEYRALAAYLADAERPAIVVVDQRGAGTEGAVRPHFGTVPVMRRLRAELPARQALRTTVYLGDPDRLLAGRPTRRPDVPGYDPISRETWRAVRPLLPRDPVIVVLRPQFPGFARELRAHPAWTPAGWVAIVAGPPASASLRDPPVPEPPEAASLVIRWAVMFGMITLAGVGWAGGLAGGPLWRRVALAPATGVAVLVPVALVAERVELRVGGGGGVVVWAGVALAGAVAAASRVPDAAELLLADPALRSPGRASRSEEP